jgi:cathepsin X
MKSLVSFLLLESISGTKAPKNSSEPCRIRHPERPVPIVKETSPDSKDIAFTWDWSNVKGTNYLTPVRNQHLPQYCNSCWAHAATSVLSDRIKIARKAEWPDIIVSPQVLLSCGDKDQGCKGGDSYNAFEWMSKNENTD